MNTPRRGIRLALWLPLLAVGVVAATQPSLAPDRPQPRVGSIPLPVRGFSWVSDVIRVDATVVGFSWEGGAPGSVAVRVSEDGAAWGPWTTVDLPVGEGPDPGGNPGKVSEAVYVGDARYIQAEVTGEPRGLRLVYVDATPDRPVWKEAAALLGRLRFGVTDRALAVPDRPQIIPRSEWGGDACLASSTDPHPEYSRRVKIMIVHATVHSATANDYRPEDVPGILYAICVFHVQINGWDDIGYNVLIDRFGRIWEGRAGGVDRPVIGAHTGGFNAVSTGVAFIGDHRSQPPTQAALDAFVSYAAWKLDVHHIDPQATIAVESNGSTLYQKGTVVQVPAIAGHRDFSSTADPGDGLYPLLAQLRQRAAAVGGPKIYGGWPDVDPVPGDQTNGYKPVAFRFRFTEEMTWTFTITAPDGAEVLRLAGTGTEAAVTWDGALGGRPLPHDDYRIRIEALPVSGAPAPTPVDEVVTLGDYTPPFADDDGSPYEPDIKTLFDLGVTKGCAPQRYCPKGEVTREQMALFITRLHITAGYTPPVGFDAGFGDVAGLSPESQAAINQLAAIGVTTGTAPGVYSPAAPVTREQMALFLVRWLTTAGYTPPVGFDAGFGDVAGLSPESQAAINQLAAIGVTTGTAPGVYSPAAPVTREQMASFLARSWSIVSASPPTNQP